MTDMKKAALAYASDGIPVFPVHSWDTDHCSCGDTQCKRAAKHPRNPGGHKKATTDPKQISDWWDRWPGSNVATCPGDTDHMVVDLDPKADREYGPDTGKVAHTPRGGLHLWYSLPKGEHIPNSASALGEDIDIRGHDGYVLLPPSSTSAGKYTWDANLAHLASNAPQTLIEEAQQGGKRQRAKDADQWKIVADQPENVTLAREAAAGRGANALYPANEGSGGDQATYEAACMMRSFGLGQEAALEVMWDAYNLRCQPPWDYEDLQVKVKNAYAYATSAPGNMTAEYQRIKRQAVVELFTAVSQDTPVTQEEFQVSQGKEARAGQFRVIDRTAMEGIKPPTWLIEDMLPDEAYAMLYGPAGSYKTFLALDIALSIANGCDEWLDGRKINANGPVLFIVGEGRSGLLKRVRAWEHYYNDSKPVKNFVLADPVPNVEEGMETFIKTAATIHEDYKLIVLDTVGRALSGANENEQKVASLLTRRISELQRAFNSTVLALHHTGHQDPKATGLARERGSSVFRADVDTMFGLQDSELHMVKQKDGELWVRPLPLVATKTQNSLVLTMGKPKTLTKQQLAYDLIASSIMAETMQAGKEYTDAAMADLIMVKEGAGVPVKTWSTRLQSLRALPTQTRNHYDAQRGKWFKEG